MESIKPRPLIVGGGIAGLSAAIALGGRGYRPLVLEKKNSPGDSVCGEFVSGEALPLLSQLGVGVHNLQGARISHICLNSRKHRLVRKLPLPALGVSRGQLGRVLEHCAFHQGVEIQHGQAVQEVQQVEGVWAVKTSQREFSGDAVFWASGKRDVKSFQRRFGKEQNSLAFKIHFKMKPKFRKDFFEQIQFFLFQGGYLGISHVEGDETNMSLIINSQIYKEIGKSWSHLLDYLGTQNTFLGEFLKNHFHGGEKPLALSPIPYGYVYSEKNNSFPEIYRLGDQFATIPSFSGDGISIAISTAISAVEHFCLNRGEKVPQFHRSMARTLGPRMRVAQFLHPLVQYRGVPDIILLGLKFWPVSLDLIFNLTRCKIFQQQRRFS